jgi:hypothetical protein
MPRQTRLTHDEVKTLLSLWAMLRSPLFIGGDLPSMDPWTTALLTNPDLIAVDQHSSGGRQVSSAGDTVTWMARARKKRESFLAVFNLGDARHTVNIEWKNLALPKEKYEIDNLWDGKNQRRQASLTVSLEPHACALYRLR